MRLYGMPSRREPAWRRASFCAAGECVEIAKQDDMILLRNSQAPGTAVRYTPEEWRAFAQGFRAGEFDDLA